MTICRLLAANGVLERTSSKMRRVESRKAASDDAPIDVAAKVSHRKILWCGYIDQTPIPPRRQFYSVGHTPR